MSNDVHNPLPESINLCPNCKKPLRCEKRGSDYFAWCGGTGEGWGMGCSGVGQFGESPAEAKQKIWDIAMSF